jgi:DNA gyrase subunit B
MEKIFKGLQGEGFSISDVNVTEEDGEYEFTVTERQNGGQSAFVNWEFLASQELRNMIGIHEKFSSMLQGVYTIAGEEEVKKVDGPHQLMTELMERARKGLTIQRYKGLGEMNPEQLWTTTMDPEKRSLLQIRVEDVVDADDIFTVLMGDKVEPRREFIQNNALEVTELDI